MMEERPLMVSGRKITNRIRDRAPPHPPKKFTDGLLSRDRTGTEFRDSPFGCDKTGKDFTDGLLSRDRTGQELRDSPFGCDRTGKEFTDGLLSHDRTG